MRGTHSFTHSYQMLTRPQPRFHPINFSDFITDFFFRFVLTVFYESVCTFCSCIYCHSHAVAIIKCHKIEISFFLLSRFNKNGDTSRDRHSFVARRCLKTSKLWQKLWKKEKNVGPLNSLVLDDICSIRTINTLFLCRNLREINIQRRPPQTFLCVKLMCEWMNTPFD